jgi:hypothetical protein
MPITPASTKELPLPARIFRAAMEQQRSLADYAQSLGIGADELRAIVMAQLDNVEPDILNQLADLYQQPRKTLRDQLPMTPPQESFAAWLKRNMEGISQHALRTRVQLDSKSLKRFLNGEMLPDSDQAERLARALYVDRTELAGVVTATMIDQADAVHLVDTTGTSEAHRTIRPPRTRRQKATSHAEQTIAEGAAAYGGTKTAGIVGEPQTAPEADLARRPAARRQAGTKIATPPSHPTPPSPIDPVPAIEIKHAKQPTADRQAGTTAAAASEIPTTSPLGAIVHRDNPTVSATGSDLQPAFKAPTQLSTRRQRRSGTEAKPGAAVAASPVITPREGETLVSQAAVERDPAADTILIATDAPGVIAPPTEVAVETNGAVRLDRKASARSSSHATDASTASTTTALASTPAPLPSAVAADTTTLQLTADEVRLIRHWRQLHPHGRRATLHYIGSLLVED